MSGVGSSVKICTGCGLDVSQGPRMKDEAGRYWCTSCGEIEWKRNYLAQSGLCAGCGDSFSDSQLTLISRLPYCGACIGKGVPKRASAKSKTKGPSFFRNRREMVLTWGTLAVLTAIVLYKLL